MNKQIWPILAIFFGMLTMVGGGLFMAAYILEAVVKQAGKPDQSLLFWYLPMLFIGLFGLIIGTVSSIWGMTCLKKIRQGNL